MPKTPSSFSFYCSSKLAYALVYALRFGFAEDSARDFKSKRDEFESRIVSIRNPVDGGKFGTVVSSTTSDAVQTRKWSMGRPSVASVGQLVATQSAGHRLLPAPHRFHRPSSLHCLLQKRRCSKQLFQDQGTLVQIINSCLIQFQLSQLLFTYTLHLSKKPKKVAKSHVCFHRCSRHPYVNCGLRRMNTSSRFLLFLLLHIAFETFESRFSKHL